jgi:fumarylacetoacetate (FAA) hydrolase
MIEQGAAQTGFMRFGDRVHMDVQGSDGQSLFGAIDQRVVQAQS